MFTNIIAFLDWLTIWLVLQADKHPGVIALLGVFIAYFLYINARYDKKKDAAKLIYQEMRYSEAKITAYRVHHTYTFTEKVLPTNSWHANIGLFVNDLDTTELDRISRFYSNAEYLDGVITAISNSHIEKSLNPTLEDEAPGNASRVETGAQGSTGELIEAISSKIEGITQSTAGQKLKQIASKKRFRLFDFRDKV